MIGFTSQESRRPAGDAELVLWPGVLGTLSFDRQLRVARLACFDSLAVNPLTLQGLLDSGMNERAIVERAAASGLRLTRLDGLSGWAPSWLPEADHPAYARYNDRFNFSARQGLDLCAGMGMMSVVAVCLCPHGRYPDTQLADCFATFCLDAAARGLRVELEFIPFSGVRSLPEAWRLLQLAGLPANAGLMIDTWHLSKSPSDLLSDLALLRELPRGVCSSMQLSDSPVHGPSCDPYGELVRDGRGFPGEGVLPIPQIVAAAARHGGLHSVGPEPSGPAILGDSLENIADRAAFGTRRAMLAAAALMAD